MQGSSVQREWPRVTLPTEIYFTCVTAGTINICRIGDVGLLNVLMCSEWIKPCVFPQFLVPVIGMRMHVEGTALNDLCRNIYRELKRIFLS